MTRKALIIGYQGEEHPDKSKGELDYLSGVATDIRKYGEYLHELKGGAWEWSEIETLTAPTALRVRRAIGEMSDADYTVVVFSGHGDFDMRVNNEELAINKRECIHANDLLTGAERALYILDCCRVPEHEREHMTDSLSKSLFSMEADDSHLRAAYRAKFDVQLEASAKGDIFVYACSVGESSSDLNAKYGGRFSYHFLDAASGHDDLDVNEVFLKGKEALMNDGRPNKQTPCITQPRGMRPSFPFYLSGAMSNYERV